MDDMILGVWREGRELVIASEVVRFPQRCLRSNEPIGPELTSLEVVWEQPGVRRDKFTLRLPLNAAWARKSRSKRGLCLLFISLLLFFVCGALGAFGNEFFLIGLFAGVLGMIGSPFLIFAQSYRIVRVKNSANGFVWLRGAHRDFLASLPDWPGEEAARSALDGGDSTDESSQTTGVAEPIVQVTNQYDSVTFERSNAWVKYALGALVCVVVTVFSAVELSQLEHGHAEAVRVWAPVAFLYNTVGFSGAVAFPGILAVILAVLAIVGLARRHSR